MTSLLTACWKPSQQVISLQGHLKQNIPHTHTGCHIRLFVFKLLSDLCDITLWPGSSFKEATVQNHLSKNVLLSLQPATKMLPDKTDALKWGTKTRPQVNFTDRSQLWSSVSHFWDVRWHILELHIVKLFALLQYLHDPILDRSTEALCQ